jgi:hypothetical protein
VAARKLQVVLRSFEKAAVPVSLVQLPGLRTRFADAFFEFAAPRLRDRLNRIGRVDRRYSPSG